MAERCLPEETAKKAMCLLMLHDKERLPRDLDRIERRICWHAKNIAEEAEHADIIRAVDKLYDDLEVEKLMGPLPRYEERCFICDKKMESSVGEFFDEDQGELLGLPPSGGIAFETCGNYGSTVFDSMSGANLQIVICDECVKARKEKIVFFRTHRVNQNYCWKRWEPDTDYD